MSEGKWGLWSALPEGTSVAWGARAILKNGRIDLLWDRQSMKGCVPDRQDFARFLNKRVLLAVHETIEALWNTGQLKPNKDEKHVLYDDDTCTVVGNTNASYGYLYMLAWRKE
jgi:hypothetical protein